MSGGLFFFRNCSEFVTGGSGLLVTSSQPAVGRFAIVHGSREPLRHRRLSREKSKSPSSFAKNAKEGWGNPSGSIHYLDFYFVRNFSGLAACGRDDSVHPKIFDDLAIMVVGVPGNGAGHSQTGDLSFTKGTSYSVGK